MGLLEGKVAIVTGAGRGMGRSEAILLAHEGAAVVVNDPGVSPDGVGHDEGPAALVVQEIEAAGGRAVPNFGDCADWDDAERLVAQAIDSFGRLDILVNNAGILRDRMSFNLSEDDWDAVIRVNLKGHFTTSRHAAAHWRACSKAGQAVSGRIINTTSEAGTFGNVGQLSYGAAKAGVAAMTLILAQELERLGVTVNAISPRASTRMTGTGGLGASPSEGGAPAGMTGSPDDVASLVAYLVSDLAASITGQVFFVSGGTIRLVKGWRNVETLQKQGAWSLEELSGRIGELFVEHSSRPEPPPHALELQQLMQERSGSSAG